MVMKKILITSVFLGLALSSYSQLKHFFPDSNAYFSVSWMKFWFQGDTIIENMKYKKVYWQTHDSIADFKKTQYFAAMREDTIAKKFIMFLTIIIIRNLALKNICYMIFR
jgi:hypothetical protein